MKILNALKGISGEFEVQRILGAFGSVVYITTAPALVWSGKVTASLESFCIQFPLGLGACILTTAGAIAIKDRQVAKAKVTENMINAVVTES